jgi:hypothetical protein
MSHSADALYKMSDVVEVDIIATVIRFRGAPAPAGGHGDDASESDSGHDGDRAAPD